MTVYTDTQIRPADLFDIRPLPSRNDELMRLANAACAEVGLPESWRLAAGGRFVYDGEANDLNRRSGYLAVLALFGPKHRTYCQAHDCARWELCARVPVIDAMRGVLCEAAS